MGGRAALWAPVHRILIWEPFGYAVSFRDLILYCGIAYVCLRAALAWAGVKYGTVFILPERGWQTVYSATVANQHWLTARLGDFQSGHIWAWTLIGGLAAFLAWRLHSPLHAFLATGFVVGLHESVWYGVYFWKHPIASEIARNLSLYWPYMLFAGIWVALFALTRTYQHFHAHPLWLVWGMWILGLWPWVFDFRLSLDLKVGATADYLDPFVNGLEFTSWTLLTASMALSGVWRR